MYDKLLLTVCARVRHRNLHQLQMHTVTLAQEQRSMEENLQQLKETMSKQKEERR